jgi:hypothetical protein
MTTDTRTDNSTIIRALRKHAHFAPDRSGYEHEAEVAASDLLEIHDATGINLGQAPRLAAFVTAVVVDALGDVVANELQLDNGA